MPNNRKSELKKLAGLYGLTLHYAERYGKVYKLYTEKGEFALKSIRAEKGMDFLRSVQMLYQKGYNRIVPVYPAEDGRYGILHEGRVYYLMPWLENREREDHFEKHQQLFRELARLHMLSRQEVPVQPEERKAHYESMSAAWEKEQEFLESFLVQSEKEWYMSPFQLIFCTCYQEISRSLSFARDKIKQWYEATKDVEKSRTVIVHGKISVEHFLYDERGIGYFTNFEDIREASPIHDLLPFLSRSLNTFPKRFDEGAEWLATYFRHFPFTEEERLLFLCYLAHPGPVCRTVEKYTEAGSGRNELMLVREFQWHYWHMKNTEYLVMKLEEAEQQKQAAMESPPSD